MVWCLGVLACCVGCADVWCSVCSLVCAWAVFAGWHEAHGPKVRERKGACKGPRKREGQDLGFRIFSQKREEEGFIQKNRHLIHSYKEGLFRAIG